MNPEQESLLNAYVDAVVQAPPYLHLTSESDLSNFRERHVVDGIQIHDHTPAEFFGVAKKVADLGTGNGVPGIVLAILEPLWDICMIDSDSKKSLFIDTFIKNAPVKNARMQCERIEEVGRGPLRGSFDLAYARALGKLPVVLELGAPLLKEGGVLVVPHGTSWDMEWLRSQNAAKELGLTLVEKKTYVIGVISFCLAIFKKDGKCSNKYPRRFAQIKKRPL